MVMTLQLPAMLFYREKVRWLQFSPPRAAHYGPRRGTDAFLLGGSIK